MRLCTQSVLAMPQSSGNKVLYHSCLLKPFLAGKAMEDHGRCCWRTGILAVTVSLFISIHPVVSPCAGQGWTCCPKGWKRFQKSCYYLSADLMPLAESEQNCTGMGSHLAVITSEAEQVGAGLRGAQQPATQCQALEGTQTPQLPQGSGDALSAALQCGSPLPPAPSHGDPRHLPPLSPAPHGRCTLPCFQTFLTRQLPQPRAGANYYIGLRAQEVGQWQWVDGTPFNETAA